MKCYSIRWEESHAVTIQAENEADAVEKVMQCDYDHANESVEISASPEAVELENYV